MADARTLVLVRHGETDWNLSGRAQGHADIPLNDTGRAQAQAVARRLAGFAPVRLWSSDLARASQTAEAIAATTGLTVELDSRLREYDVGERSGLTLDEAAEQFPEEFATYRSVVLAAARSQWTSGALSTPPAARATVPRPRR